jgi:hypothetical protein
MMSIANKFKAAAILATATALELLQVLVHEARVGENNVDLIAFLITIACNYQVDAIRVTGCLRLAARGNANPVAHLIMTACNYQADAIGVT